MSVKKITIFFLILPFFFLLFLKSPKLAYAEVCWDCCWEGDACVSSGTWSDDHPCDPSTGACPMCFSCGTGCGPGCGTVSVTPKANIDGYITLNGGGRVGQSTNNAAGRGGIAYGGINCLTCLYDTACWDNAAIGYCMDTCTPVIEGVNITGPVLTGWWCPAQIHMGGNCGINAEGEESWWFCKKQIDIHGINFSFSSMPIDTSQTFTVTGVPAGYACSYTFTINGVQTSGTGCTFTSPVLPEGTHSLVVDLNQPLACPTNFSVSCNAAGTQATINWDDLAGAASYLVRLNREPYSDWSNPAAGDQGLPAASSNITANITPDYNYQYDVQGIKPGESYPYSGAQCPYDIFNCPSPKGTIRGSIINYAKEANSIAAKYIDAALPACGGNEVLSVPVNITGTQTVATSALLCDTAPVQDVPYFIESLKLGTYNVTATVPAGWQAVSWQCVSTGTSCPSAIGAGNTISGINLTNTTDQTWIFFRIQPIPPKCTISGSTNIVAGETGTFIASETVGGIVPNVQMKKVLSTCLATNTCISSATPLASSNCTMVGCLSSVSYSWITTEADMTPSDGSQPWYFYCQGYNGLINLTSRQCRPFNPYAYPWDLDCVGPAHSNICDPNSGTDCIKVNVTEPPPWYQVWGGDVHARGDLTSYLPIVMATDDPTHNYFNLNAETLLSGFPGLISLDSTYLYDFASGSGDWGTAKSSTKKWLAKSNFSYAPSSTEDSVYDYYLKKLGNPAAGTFDCGSTHNFNNLSDVQIIRPPASAEGCSITGNWNVTGGSQVIVLVDTALNILDQNTRITVDEESFLAFIAKDGINIDYQLGVKKEGYTETPYVQGVYMTDGQINTGINPNMSGRRFIGAGMFYAKDGFVLARDLKDSPSEGTARNWNTPAELFIYRPDLAVNSPSVMWSSEMDWQEIAP